MWAKKTKGGWAGNISSQPHDPNLTWRTSFGLESELSMGWRRRGRRGVGRLNCFVWSKLGIKWELEHCGYMYGARTRSLRVDWSAQPRIQRQSQWETTRLQEILALQPPQPGFRIPPCSAKNPQPVHACLFPKP